MRFEQQPTTQEIRDGARAIRQSWSAAERRLRLLRAREKQALILAFLARVGPAGESAQPDVSVPEIAAYSR